MASIKSFEVGHCTHPSCMILKNSGFASRCFPARSYLISAKKGLYLWDTGYTNHFKDASKGIYSLYPMVTPVYFESSQSIVSQLKSDGVSVADITAIVVSHFHADHYAGLLDFKDTPVVADVSSWRSVQGLTGIRALHKAFLPGLVPVNISTRLSVMQSLTRVALPKELSEFGTGWDLTGDGEIILVNLPGHAEGHIGAFVAVDSGWTLLASDAAWAPEAYTELRGPSEISFLVQHSRSAYYQTLQKLNNLYRSTSATIMLTHELPNASFAPKLTSAISKDDE